MPYDFFDHTGDIGVTLAAPTVEELFVTASQALSDALTEIRAVQSSSERAIALEADDLDLLLVDWLREQLYAFEVEGFLAAGARVTVARTGAVWRAAGVLEGETFDAARHGIKVLVKAVTYHALQVAEVDGAWRATLVFDI